MALGLHVAPHQTEAEPWLPGLGDEAGNDRVERPLARLEPIEMLRVECEQRTAVLKRKAQIGRDVVRTEAMEVALDQADAVEVAIDHSQVNRVGLQRVRPAWGSDWLGPVSAQPRRAAYGLEIRAAIGNWAKSGSA